MSKKSALEMVEEFHKTYNCPVYTQPTIPDTQKNDNAINETLAALLRHIKKSEDKSRSFLRFKLMLEELIEIHDCINRKNMVGIVDGLCDLLYVVYGTAHEFGLGPLLKEAFAEVHRSNMSKLDNDGKPIYREDGKVLKGPNFTPPNLITIIQKHTDSY